MTKPHTDAGAPRGSALMMVTILLAVLAVIGVAAVSLSSQERTNAAAKGRRDIMTACADAARMMIWAETAKYGSSRLRTQMQEQRVTLADGTILSAPAHYAPSPDIQSVEIAHFSTPNPATSDQAIECTNEYCRDASLTAALSYAFVARCRDVNGRAVEVEFSTQLLF